MPTFGGLGGWRLEEALDGGPSGARGILRTVADACQPARAVDEDDEPAEPEQAELPFEAPPCPKCTRRTCAEADCEEHAAWIEKHRARFRALTWD